MKCLHSIATLALAVTLAGCASHQPTLREARALASQSAAVDSFAALTVRYRDTYAREQPYLTPEADRQARLLEPARRAACDDFLQIGQSVLLYMRTLGQLAGSDQDALSDTVRRTGGAIKAWPDSGLDQQHVSAYTAVGRLLARALTDAYQGNAVQQMIEDGDAPLQTLLDAMRTLLRHYDKSATNEQKIVLGMLETETALAEARGERLLPALAKAQYQQKSADYQASAERFQVAQEQLARLAQAHRALREQRGARAGPPAPVALTGSDSAAERLAGLPALAD